MKTRLIGCHHLVLPDGRCEDMAVVELDEQVRGLQEDLAKLKGALEQANSENLRLAAENTRLHEALDKSLQEQAKAEASLQSMKRLLPFLDPKHLDKVCVG